MERIFAVSDFIRPSDTTPLRSVVLETPDSVVIVWHVAPGQEIPSHLHPHGQDTWTVLSGMADYYFGNGIQRTIKAGEIAVARPGEIHGAFNCGKEDFTFVSVVSSDKAGYVVAPK